MLYAAFITSGAGSAYSSAAFEFVCIFFICISTAEFLKFVGPKGSYFRHSDRSLILGSPIVRQTFCCCFICNGFAKHVPWLLISCLTDCLCYLGSKYNGRICPGFINSKSSKQSYPQSFCN
jgi:hypothetical protein